ncbi:MAG: hypothetical protein KGM24_02115, partial [Elusimicrobia bacterium]|nr:hypothetical protein [Elusimicrobiota bacterium]
MKAETLLPLLVLALAPLGARAADGARAPGGAVAVLDRDLGILRDGLARDPDAVTLRECDALAALKNRPDVLFLAYFSDRRTVRWFSDPALIAAPYRDFARRYGRPAGRLDRLFETKAVQASRTDGGTEDLLIPVLDGGRATGAVELEVLRVGTIPAAVPGDSRVRPSPKDDGERRHWINALVLSMAGRTSEALAEAPHDADCAGLRRRLAAAA